MGWMLRLRLKDPVKTKLEDSLEGQFTALGIRAGSNILQLADSESPRALLREQLSLLRPTAFAGLGCSWRFRPVYDSLRAGQVAVVDQGLQCYSDAPEIQPQDLCSFACADVREVRGSPGKGLVLPSHGFSRSETILVWESHSAERDLDPERNLIAGQG